MQQIDKLLFIKNLVREGLPSDDNLDSILQDKVQRNYLFQLLNTKPFRPSDFLSLYKHGGFVTVYIPTKERNIVVNGQHKSVFQSWVATQYLKKAGEFIEKMEDQAVISVLEEIIAAYITYIAENRSGKAYSFDDNAIGEVILKLPLNLVFQNAHYHFLRQHCLNEQYLTVCNEIIERFYPRVLEHGSSRIALLTIKLLSEYEVNEQGYGSVESKVQDFYLKGFLEKCGKSSFDKIGSKLFKFILDLIEDVSEKEVFAFSSIDIPLLFENNDAEFTANKFSVFLVEFLKIGLSDLSAEQTSELLLLLSYYDGDIFKRIILYLIGKYYYHLQVKNYVLDISNPINDIESLPEVWSVALMLLKSGDEALIRTLHKWSETIDPPRYKEESHEDYKRRFIEIKTRWEKLLSEEGETIASKSTRALFIGRDTIPEEKDRIINVSEKEIISLFVNHETWVGYNQDGIISDIRQLGKQTIGTLLSNKEAKDYLPEVLWALIITHEFALEDWDNFFKLVSDLILQERRWDFSKIEEMSEEHYSHRRTNYNQNVWKAISEVFRSAASQRKEVYFSSTNCQKAIDLLLQIEPKTTNSFKILNKGQEYIDAVNTVKGSLYQSLIELVVALTIMADKKEFYDPVAKLFQTRLEQEQTPEELLWIIGANLVRIGYMDIAWLDKNRTLLFEDKAGEDLKVLKSYLIATNTVYKDLYNILNPYYLKAVSNFTRKDNYTGKLIQHICIASGSEWQFSDVLLDAIFDENNTVHFTEMIQFYSRRSKRDKQSRGINTEQVLELWKKIVLRLQENKLENAEKLPFDLLKWVQNFDKFSDNLVSLIFKTMDLINHFPFDYSTMDFFSEMSKVDPEIVGRIINKGLSRSSGFDLTSYEQLTTITQKLYEQGIIEEADQIVNALVDRDYYFLVDLYEQHHS